MIIWPAKGSDTDSTRDVIEEYFDSQGPPLSNYTSQFEGLILWYINIINKQARDIAGLDGVSGIEYYLCCYSLTINRYTLFK